MTAAETHWPAPAKLNLFLHVTGRRADGYHELQTLFQLIDLCDTVTINVREDGQTERPLGAPAGTAAGGGLRAQRRIPLGAGLGGGSSDAATTLLVLNELWDCGLSMSE